MRNVADDDVHTLDIDDRGRVTIPKAVRDDWGLSSGDRLEIGILGTADGYECDDCGDSYDLREVIVEEAPDGEIESVTCGDCMTIEDQITDSSDPDDRAWLCGSCQATILATSDPDGCPECGAPSEQIQALEAARVEEGSA